MLIFGYVGKVSGLLESIRKEIERRGGSADVDKYEGTKP